MTWHISPRPTCIAKFVDGDFCGGELWVSGTFDNMADWLASNGFDVQVARLELCCPCCRIFETSMSKKFWAGGVHAVAFSKHRHQKMVGHPQFAYFGRFFGLKASPMSLTTTSPQVGPRLIASGTRSGTQSMPSVLSCTSMWTIRRTCREGREGGPGGRAAPAPHTT